MPFIYDDYFTFFHIPKTGGTYARRLLKLVAKKREKVGHTHGTPLDLPKLPNPNTSVCIIRHPVDWYKSLYYYCVDAGHARGRNHLQKIDAMITWSGGTPCPFDEFINRVINVHPKGFVTNLYLAVVPFCRHVLRQEQLDYELQRLLQFFGYYYYPDYPKQNVSKKDHIKLEMSNSTLEKIQEAEMRAIRWLGYKPQKL